MERDAAAYWLNSPGTGSIESTPLRDSGERSICLRTLASAVSPGTERLVGLGQVAPADHEAMRCAYMEGSFSFPLKYGYALVGVDDADNRFFVMHPHQTAAVIDAADAVPLPHALPTLRALLFPALETAQNAVWDAEISRRDSVAVVGGGLIGIAVAYVLQKTLGVPVPLIEASGERREHLERYTWLDVRSPDAPVADELPSCLFHCSASEAGLQWCIDHSAFEARVVELSWYGEKPVTLSLGSGFHHGRKRIISSQVAHVAAPMRHSLGKEGRRAAVLEHLTDEKLDELIHPVADFSELPALMQAVYRGARDMILPAIRYPGAQLQ